MMVSGSAVQVKGLGMLLLSATKRLMAIGSSWTERKTPRFNRRLESLAKEALDGVQPGAGRRHEWKTNRGCRSSEAHLRALVGGIVVEDDMDDLADRNLRLDGVEEADELLMAMGAACCGR